MPFVEYVMLTWEKIPGSPHFSILQCWAGAWELGYNISLLPSLWQVGPGNLNGALEFIQQPSECFQAKPYLLNISLPGSLFLWSLREGVTTTNYTCAITPWYSWPYSSFSGSSPAFCSICTYSMCQKPREGPGNEARVAIKCLYAKNFGWYNETRVESLWECVGEDTAINSQNKWRELDTMPE